MKRAPSATVQVLHSSSLTGVKSKMHLGWDESMVYGQARESEQGFPYGRFKEYIFMLMQGPSI